MLRAKALGPWRVGWVISRHLLTPMVIAMNVHLLLAVSKFTYNGGGGD